MNEEMDEKIVLHHIGAAGMTYPFKHRDSFLDDFIVYLYDANKDIIPDNNEGNVNIIHCCVGKKEERKTFYVTWNPSESSLLQFNPEYKTWYVNYYADCCLCDTAIVTAEEEMDVLPLDSAITRHKAIRPDIISIDAEGMSYDILTGTTESLEYAVAVLCEVEFDELRLGQKTFADVNELLRDRYYFAGFVGQEWNFSPHRCPLGFRGLAFPLARDALFLRKKQTIQNNCQMAKLAFISFLYGFIEYGFHAALSCDVKIFDPAKRQYLKFISELVKLYKSESFVYKPTFKDINKSRDDSWNRYTRKDVNTDIDFLQKKYAMEMKILSLKGSLTPT